MSRTPMKLILTQEVSGLGAPGDVVDVAAGYGRNYLLPRGFAMPWTRGAEKQVELIKRARAAREIRTLEDAQAAAAKLQKLTVRLKRRAGSNGRLFGSVGPSDIAAAVRDAGGPEVDRLAPGPGAPAPRRERCHQHRDHSGLIHSSPPGFPQLYPQGELYPQPPCRRCAFMPVRRCAFMPVARRRPAAGLPLRSCRTPACAWPVRGRERLASSRD